MKNIITLIILLLLSFRVFADATSAKQTVTLTLMPHIEINAGNKSSINMNSKGNQQFTVKSNKDFKVSVNTTTPKEKLVLSLTGNQIKGVASNNSNNMVVSDSSAELLSNCVRGNEQTFAVSYKAKTSAAVIYTATQM